MMPGKAAGKLAPGEVPDSVSRTGAAARAISVLRYSPAFFAFIVVVADAGRWADPDLWGHITFGRLILSLGHVPAHDIYSYSAFGRPWRDHEWLSEVILALCYNSGGIIGLKLLKLVCTAATMALLAMAAAQTGAAISLQLIVLTIAALALGPMLQFRPQLFDFIGLSALLLMLARDSYRRAGPLWPAIPILALWANLHGGFFIGLAVLGAYAAIVAVEDWWNGDGFGRASRVVLVFAACTLATLANPYGIAIWTTVLHTLDYPLTRAIISEWQPLAFRIVQEWHRSPLTAINFALAIVPFAALVVCFVIRPRGGDLPLVVIAATMGAGAWIAVRNLALMVIAWVIPLCRHGKLVFEDSQKRRRLDHKRSRGARWYTNQALVGAIALVVAIQTGLFSPTLPASITMPQGAVAFMRAHRLSGNILCNFAWGEYLIFHMAPGSTVFIDARYDMVYPKAVIRDYLAFYMGSRDGSRMLAGYPHDYVLIRPGSPAYHMMRAQHGWQIIYSDQVAALFARSKSAAARLVGVPVKGHAGASYFP